MVPKAGLYQRGLLKSLKTWAIPHTSAGFRLFGIPLSSLSLSHSTGLYLSS
jgi:hypothetical protein